MHSDQPTVVGQVCLLVLLLVSSPACSTGIIVASGPCPGGESAPMRSAPSVPVSHVASPAAPILASRRCWPARSCCRSCRFTTDISRRSRGCPATCPRSSCCCFPSLGLHGLPRLPRLPDRGVEHDHLRAGGHRSMVRSRRWHNRACGSCWPTAACRSFRCSGGLSPRPHDRHATRCGLLGSRRPRHERSS